MELVRTSYSQGKNPNGRKGVLGYFVGDPPPAGSSRQQARRNWPRELMKKAACLDKGLGMHVFLIIEDKTGLKQNSLFGTERKHQLESIDRFCEKMIAGQKVPSFCLSLKNSRNSMN